MSAKDKNGLGYGTQFDEMSNKSETDSEISTSVFEVRSSDEEITPANDRFSKADGYHAVPPPKKRNFLTLRADILFAGLDEYAIRKKIIESKTAKPRDDTSESKTSETVGKTNEVEKYKTKINRDKFIIEDWNSDDEMMFLILDHIESKIVISMPKRVQKLSWKQWSILIKGWSNQYRIMVKGPNEKRAVHTVSTARPISTVRPRSYYTRPAVRPKDLKQDVKTFGVKNMTTAGTRAVVNTGKGKMDNALKKSRWVWRPKGNYMDHESKEKGSFILKKFEYVDPKGISKSVDHAVVDSGCSSHMTGNKAYLSDYEDYNGGFVAFGSDPKGGKITGKGKIRTANLDFDDVYFVDELKFNLFSVSQMCDKKNSVLFTDTECLILSPSFKLLIENQV
ncbi:hypothetical protein Tco_1058490 [Tanacetum coccineum]|uniref:Retrovirus-related Pol polyprotein from transposon TNT 1-94-like beta-barrel domain-containing protein n=1 Tax=Tanacetum coccineum TaxID=301880 RepID=A0ABQ5H8W8_9ASTR